MDSSPENKCPLCGGTASLYMPLPHTSVFRCAARACGLQFAAPQLCDHDLAQAYASLYYRPDGSPATFHNKPEVDCRHLMHRLAAHFGSPAGKRVLDYGCGVGTLLKVANDMGARAAGIEQSATARETIAAGGFAIAYADAAELRRAEPDAQFDWIILLDVIEHLRRPWEELESLRLLMHPAAELIILTPNFEALRSRLSGARCEQRTNLTHFYYFTRHSLSAVLRKAGFVPKELPPLNWHSEHGFLRRQLQRVLAATRLQGSMMFSARAAAGRHATAAD